MPADRPSAPYAALGAAVLLTALADWRRLQCPLHGPVAAFLFGREGAALRRLWCEQVGLDADVFAERCRREAYGSPTFAEPPTW